MGWRGFVGMEGVVAFVRRRVGRTSLGAGASGRGVASFERAGPPGGGWLGGCGAAMRGYGRCGRFLPGICRRGGAGAGELCGNGGKENLKEKKILECKMVVLSFA